ncbi:MAG TPA: hypothetical protein VK436_04310, partial [Methanocella sp.]|nr:hypothetical protein [Methanocella sp.]
NASLNIKREGMKLWLEGMEHAGSPAEQIVNTISEAACKLSATKQEAPSIRAGQFTIRYF